MTLRHSTAGRFALTAALLCTCAPAASPAAPAPISIQPPSLSVERALSSFRDLCMSGFPDGEAVERAAKASSLGFLRMESGLIDSQDWISRSADLGSTETGRGSPLPPIGAPAPIASFASG